MRSRSLFSLFLLAPFLLPALSAQGRPALVQESRAFAGASRAPARGYFSSPDTVTLVVEGGAARAGRPAAVLLALGRSSSPIPIGPDRFDLDPSALMGAWFTALDSKGKGKVVLPVPAGLATGGVLFFQALVLPKGEPWPVRLSPSLEAALLPSKGFFYVDGDATGPEKGTPFAPYHKVSPALKAAATAGGGTVWVDGLSSGTYKEVLFITSSRTTLEGKDWTGGGQGVPTIEGVMDNTPDKKRGTINARGTASSPLTGITIRRLRVLPSGYLPLRRSARCLRADYVQGLRIADCLMEGSAGHGTSSIMGINLGLRVKALVEHCTIRRLAADPAAQTGNFHYIGIKLVQGTGEATIRNCRIHDLGFMQVNGAGFQTVTGIWCPGGNKLIVENSVIGPFVLPKAPGPKGPDTDLYGIWMEGSGVIRNNVFHRLDCSAFQSNVKQIAGVWFYRAGKVEFTNNIFADFRLGPVVGIHTLAAAVALYGSQTATYSCAWKFNKPFHGVSTGVGVILNKDPLLVPPAYTLKQGSPCLGTGNPLYPPRNMGVYGGPRAGYPGHRW